ncbi:MAG: phage holin family protein [Candidatus Peribacteraceae bacterium]|jgi:putative membrane protein
MSLPLRLTLRFALNIALVWALVAFVPQAFVMDGGFPASIIIGALLTLMNLVVRPLLDVVTLPLKLVATLLAFILVNGLFVWLTVWAAQRLDPSLVSLQIDGGLPGWLSVILVFGIGNWLMKMLLR